MIIAIVLSIDYRCQHYEGIIFFYIMREDVENHEKKMNLESRYMKVKTLPGTRSHHCFKPLPNTEILEMRRLSSDDICSRVYFDGRIIEENMHSNIADYQPGRYVACVYDGQWYIGNIVER
jgi:hypothetical protein